jgi:2-polyprenyl-6-methoxyphenol hydroxylase-like FAD-dependent oxidoreductase
MFTELPVIVAGGGITAALVLRRRECAVQVIERAPKLGEIGAGIQLGPNAFAAFDALGIGPIARSRVGAVVAGDRVVGRIDGVGEIELRVGAAY